MAQTKRLSYEEIKEKHDQLTSKRDDLLYRNEQEINSIREEAQNNQVQAHIMISTIMGLKSKLQEI